MEEHRNYVLISLATLPGEKSLSYEIEMPGDELAFCNIYEPETWNNREKFQVSFKADFIDPDYRPGPFDVIKQSKRGWYTCRSRFRPELVVDQEVMEDFLRRYNQKHALNKNDGWVFEPFNIKLGVTTYSYNFGDVSGIGLGLRYIKVGPAR